MKTINLKNQKSIVETRNMNKNPRKAFTDSIYNKNNIKLSKKEYI